MIFNCTHERQGKLLFPCLIDAFVKADVCFQKIVFTTNDAYSGGGTGDLVNRMVDVDVNQGTQHELLSIFSRLAVEKNLKFNPNSLVVVKSVKEAADEVSECHQCLITGSLHLIGSALTVFKAECR